MKVIVFISLLAAFPIRFAQAQQRRIIDMHIHAYDSAVFAQPVDPQMSKTATAHFNDTYAALKKFKVVKAMVSGSPASVDNWIKQDSNHLFIKGIVMGNPTDYGMDTTRLEQLIKDKKIEVFGEIANYYAGTTLTDSLWQPYLRMCQKYNVPVAVHVGGGPPGVTYFGFPKARLSLSDPFLLEDILVKYPKLRLYMMHSGEVYYEHTVRLMMMYPQLYSDLGALLWVTPYTQRYASEFLKQAKEAGCLNRVMYGTDQMFWPHAIEKSLQFLDGLSFLTKQEKDSVLYNNAARFLQLTK